MTAPTTSLELERWSSTLLSGDQYAISELSRDLAEKSARIDTRFTFTLCDKMWRKQGDITGWIMEGTGTDPRNNTPTARLVIKADCPFWENFRHCRNTMVGVIVETAGQRYPFYVKKFTEHYEKGELTGIVELKGIWDILNYLVIWPSWYLPIQAQPFSHAVFLWALCTVLESMVSECALRIQSGINEFINNALSLNPDIRAWFGTLLQTFQNTGGGLGSLQTMLKTPIYVKRTNPFLDTSPLAARTVRMETCGTVIADITKAYGVDTRMDLWLPGDPQPDAWANLTQPTYVFSTADRSQIKGPFGNVLDSALRLIVDAEGSLLGRVLDPLLNPQGQNPALPDGAFEATALGVKFVAPYAIVIAPDSGKDAAIMSYDIDHHTPEGWQHIIGGRSPKVGAPPGNWGGTDFGTAHMAQRFNQRNDRLDDRLDHDRHRIHRHPKRSTGRVPQQQLLGLPVDPALRAAQRGRPVPPRRRNVHRHSVGPVQHRDDLRLHQQTMGHTRLHVGHREDQRVRPQGAVRARPRHLQGRPDVAGVRRPQVHPDRLYRERDVAHHTERARADRPTW